ncbi:uncharacterized protein MELLADRAFT_68003 [Melampsora larici-populina 98AG31]|uniref:Uncharacterized protein n=1 Tax=Melampsora larici-populina (strain 98AG31 / pathotype 3-4-7) TaxID=747676 RepID=F4S584_MELLP|nr:uncharacterized protein MELLADRAFT_68003 [Melampsora larici-populina 98AG31]EGG00204.1 hypothetical protein MELLADRAFT_68003 [Melampsora larici-populina 98AG31]
MPRFQARYAVQGSNLPQVALQEGKPEIPENNFQELSLQYMFYLPKGHNLSKWQPKSSQTAYERIPIFISDPSSKINNDYFEILKKLFTLASKINKHPTMGSTAILKLADTGKTVNIYAFIALHSYYTKGHMYPITFYKQVKSFFLELPTGAVGNAGFLININLQGIKVICKHKIPSTVPLPPPLIVPTLPQSHLQSHTSQCYKHHVLACSTPIQDKGTTSLKLDGPLVKVWKEYFVWIDVIPKPPINTSIKTPLSAVKHAKVFEELDFKIGRYA